MKVTYLGTGAAEGIPALFCNCAFCTQMRREKKIRSRAQVLIDGELSVDFPPDCFYHAAALGADLSAVKYLLVTHSHMDHFYAHDFVLRGYKYARDLHAEQLTIFGNAEVGEVFAECTRRELRGDVKANIRVQTVRAFEEVCFGDWRAFPLQAKHSSKDPLVYLIERGGKRVLHLTDTGKLPEADYAFLEKLSGKPLDLITFDCTFLWGETEENARHMGLSENMRTLERLQQIGLADANTKKVITHFSHNSEPTEEALRRAEDEFGVIAAYDGLTAEV